MRFLVRAAMTTAAMATLAPLGVSACSSDDTAAPNDGTFGSSGAPGDPRNPGNEPGATIPSYVDVTRFTANLAGRERIYWVAKPKSYDPDRSYPIVFSFHGNPSNADAPIHDTPFDRVSKEDAVIVYPQAVTEAGPGIFDWDIYTPTETNADMNGIAALVSEVKKNVKSDKVYGFGNSGGAFFVVAFACRFDVFDAISTNAGGGPEEQQAGFPQREDGCYVCPGGPLPVLVTHGLLDTQVDPAGAAYTRDCYAATNGCLDRTIDIAPSPCKKYEGCAGGNDVVACMVPTQDHGLWKEALAVSWDFFRAH
jgi:polyhydroxybutyrate depolymerase